ncbi:flippase-like domain-containing protein, partial [Patescibacteria group bacterium]|nr:flippase-like domain-containing protein [Patescibacteria group bacterium]
FSKLILVLNEINYFYFFLAFLMLFPIFMIKVYRWNYLMKKQNINYSFKDSFLMYGTGMYIGIITPGRLGELSKIAFLKKNNSLGKSTVSVVVDRLTDLIFLLFFGYFGFFLFFSLFKNLILILTLILVFSLILLITFLKTNIIKFLLKKMLNLIIPAKYQKSWKINFQDFINELKIYKLKNYLFIFLITAFSWFIYYFQTYLLAKSIGINNLSFLFISIAVTIAGLVTLLPISILGIGTRDVTLIGLFNAFSINQETTVSFSFLILLIGILTGLACSICWLIKPIQFSKD